MNQILNLSVFIVPIMILLIVTYFNSKKTVSIDRNKTVGLWERFFAFLIDALIVTAIGYAFTRILDDFFHNILDSIITEEVLYFLIPWLYFACFESSKTQATLGKMFQGVKVTDKHEKRISFLNASLRFIFSFLSDMTLFIGYLIVPFTKYRQGLHDMLTHTYLLKARK